MAKIKGTNGNDTLNGTNKDDVITAYLGVDTVDGRGGYDVLTIDYSAVGDGFGGGSITLGSDGAWAGSIFAQGLDGEASSTTFKNVERVVYTGSGGNDALEVLLGPLAPLVKRLDLDGGDGDDQLTLNAAVMDPAVALSLKVSDTGAITSNIGKFAGWESFYVTLNDALGNVVTLGAGDDVVESYGGRDRIDLGAGQDSWLGNYTSITKDLDVTISAASGVVVDQGKATLAKVAGAEDVELLLGSGDDDVTLAGAATSGDISGGEGYDRLWLDTLDATPVSVRMSANASSGYYGTIGDYGDLSPVYFSDFELLTLTGSTSYDSFTLDGQYTAFADVGWLTRFNGADGSDSMTLNLQAEGATTIDMTSNWNGGSVTWTGKSNFLGWYSVENAYVTLGAGDDVVKGMREERLILDTGAGFDTLDLSTNESALTLNMGITSAQSIGTQGWLLSISNVEKLLATGFGDTLTDGAGSETILAGGGNDVVYSAAASITGADTFDGGAGVDRIDYSLATSGVRVELGVAGAQATGGGGTDTLTGFEQVTGSAYNDTLTGDAGANTLSGGNGDDVLQGLAGNDLLDGGAGTDTASYSSAGTGVTVSLATTAAQDTKGAGTDTLVGIENLLGSGYDDTLTGNTGNNVITGGAGTDVMTGGGGADRFVFRSTAETSTAYLRGDLITDFVGPGRGAGDLIDLSGIDANTSTLRTNEAFTFIGTAAFTAAGQLRAVSVGQGLFYVSGDVNGDKAADFGIYVQSTDPYLAASDFVL